MSAILVINDDFVHFEPSSIANVKVACVSVLSALDKEQAAQRVLLMTQCSNYQEQLTIERELLDIIEGSSRIIFREHGTGAEASYELDDQDHWFSLNGPLGFGDQTVLPTGELSVLKSASGKFNEGCGLNINGRLALGGGVLVHATTSRTETTRVFRELITLRATKVYADVSKGRIVNLEPGANGAEGPISALNGLFTSDAKYRLIHEIGFGTNTLARPLKHDNSVCDERNLGVHFGLGLGGATDLHIDLLCPDLGIFGQSGGSPQPFPRRPITRNV